MLKKVIVLLIAVVMAGTLASASTMVKSAKTTVTSMDAKVTKTVTKKHFKRTTNKSIKSTAIKSTTIKVAPVAPKPVKSEY